MANVIMMIGLPGAGKTSYISNGNNKLTNNIWSYISPDEVRKELYGDISIQGNAKEVFSKVDTYVLDALSEGIDVVYDATNTTFVTKTVNKFRRMGADKVNAIFLNTPISVCLERNKQRDDRSEPVPTEVIERMYRNLIRNMNEIVFDAGFDSIQIVNG